MDRHRSSRQEFFCSRLMHANARWVFPFMGAIVGGERYEALVVPNRSRRRRCSRRDCARGPAVRARRRRDRADGARRRRADRSHPDDDARGGVGSGPHADGEHADGHDADGHHADGDDRDPGRANTRDADDARDRRAGYCSSDRGGRLRWLGGTGDFGARGDDEHQRFDPDRQPRRQRRRDAEQLDRLEFRHFER